MFIRYSGDMIVGLDEFEKISTLGELYPLSGSPHRGEGTG